jgi:lysophospholipase L1-like esterase
MLINHTKLDCKQDFRDALDELINEKGYNDKISVIRYKSWNNDYENDLNRLYLNDGMHLNEKGYLVLDSMIAKTISHHYASKHGLSHDSLR